MHRIRDQREDEHREHGDTWTHEGGAEAEQPPGTFASAMNCACTFSAFPVVFVIVTGELRLCWHGFPATLRRDLESPDFARRSN